MFKITFDPENPKPWDWRLILWVMFARPERIGAFARMHHLLPDRYKYDLFGRIWVDSENIFQYGKFVTEFLQDASGPYVGLLMDRDERAVLRKMLDKIVIWRGGNAGLNAEGWSWTLHEEKAVWFAQRFPVRGHKAVVLRGVVEKKDVLAYFTREDEILADPLRVNVTSKRVVPKKGTSMNFNDWRFEDYQEVEEFEPPHHIWTVEAHSQCASLKVNGVPLEEIERRFALIERFCRKFGFRRKLAESRRRLEIARETYATVGPHERMLRWSHEMSDRTHEQLKISEDKNV